MMPWRDKFEQKIINCDNPEELKLEIALDFLEATVKYCEMIEKDGCWQGEDLRLMANEIIRYVNKV